MEAIVMNKFVIIPKHKSNKMFYKYKNVMTFTNFKEFSNSIDFVKNNQPIFFDAKIYKDFKWENCFLKLIELSDLSCCILPYFGINKIKHHFSILWLYIHWCFYIIYE